MKWLKHPFKSFSMWLATRKFVKILEEGTMDIFLETLLNLMDLYFALNKKFRRNIENFNATYVFKSRDGVIAASIIFADSKMKVSCNAIENASVTVVFKDGKALKDFLFSESPDIIGAILDNEIQYTGNLNYLSKFAYMSKRLKFELTGK
ncbi:MAG: hypothetical protein PHD97_08695 [Bacteroidales bacterium]|nr:hypothetical protein [Bacteroidales bacterium]